MKEVKQGKFIVVSGPSGVGKGTICNRLINELNAEYSVSYTTRSPREGEVDGVNYHFITREEFEKMIINGDLIEFNYYNGNFYGTGRDFVMNKINQGINIFTEIDVNGAQKIKENFPRALLIYIAPPSMEVLKIRLLDRGTEDTDTINERLEIAKNEMKQVNLYDYVVVNDDLDKAVNQVKEIILSDDKREELEESAEY